MSLYANTSVIGSLMEAFPTAQAVRELLSSHGFAPLVKIGQGEHWVRRGRRIILQYQGEIPGQAEPKDLLYADIVRIGDEYTLSLD